MFRVRLLFILLSIMLVACDSADLLAPATAAPAPTSIPPTSVPPTPVPGALVVDPSVELGAISPYILGSNYGPWIAVPVDMLPAAYDSKVKAIRFPGGAWGDRNDLKPYHIDPFMDFTQQVGAIPTIAVRLREGDPQQAADLVRYVNIKKGNEVVYWTIGNEPTLFADELSAAGRADDYDTEQFNAEWREFALAMKAVDPNIKLMGPEIHQFNYDLDTNPKDSSGRDWMVEFLKANGDLVDVVTFHRYPFPKDRAHPDASIEDLRQHSREWEESIITLRELIDEHTGRQIPIAVTEVNTHYNPAVGGEATPDSHYNAIWLAEMFGRLIRQDVFMVNHWMLTSSGGYGGWGLIGRGELRPSYHVYQLYDKFGQERVYAESGLEDVSIYAAKDENGALTLMIVNLADTEQQVTLDLLGDMPAQADLWRLDQEQVPEEASEFTFAGDGEVLLPAQSVSLLVIER